MLDLSLGNLCALEGCDFRSVFRAYFHIHARDLVGSGRFLGGLFLDCLRQCNSLNCFQHGFGLDGLGRFYDSGRLLFCLQLCLELHQVGRVDHPLGQHHAASLKGCLV